MTMEPKTFQADAEVAKSTGAMIGLLPRGIDADALERVGGEPSEDLHVTMFFFASDVTRHEFPTELVSALDAELGMFPEIHARLFAQAIFNPDGPEPCGVMLVGDSKLLAELKGVIDASVSMFGPQDPDLLQQHEPFIPHVTIGYNFTIDQLPDPEPIIFDRVIFKWAGQEYVFPLLESWELTE